MRSGVKRFMYGALFAFVLQFAVAESAGAQTTAAVDRETNATLKLDYASAVRSLVTTARPVARSRANFLRQDDDDSGIGVGVLGMITRTTVDVEDSIEDINARTGYGFGAWVGGNRNGRVGFVGEFIYAVRNVNDSDDDVDVKFKVFEIPAVFHINFGSRSRDSIGGYLVVGPVFTFNLGQTVDGEDISDDEKFKGADVGIIGGAGVEFFRVGIEGRGNWGLRSISNEGDFAKIKTFTFELLGKFAFN